MLIVSHWPRPTSLFFVFIVFGLALVVPHAVAANYVPGVQPGDQAVYGKVSAYWASTSYVQFSLLHFPLAEFLNVSSIFLQVQNISGTGLVESKTRSFANGTRTTASINGDLQTGAGTMTIWTIAAGLKKGDPVYNTSPPITINDTIPLTFAGLSRQVNNLTRTFVVGGQGPERVELLWDEATGILVSFSYSFSISLGIDGSSRGTASMNLTSTNLWSSVPDFKINTQSVIPKALSGSPQSIALTISSLSSFAGTVQLAATAAKNLTVSQPTPVSLSVDSGAPGSSIISFSAPASSLVGNYVLSLTATSGTLSHQLNFTVQVTGDFTVSGDVRSLTIPAGSSGSVMITVNSLGLTGPAGVTATTAQTAPLAVGFSQTRFNLTPGNSVVITVTVFASASATAGTYQMMVQVGQGTLSHSVAENVNVAPASSSTFGLDPTVFFAILGVIVAALAVGVILAIRRKSSRAAKGSKRMGGRKPKP